MPSLKLPPPPPALKRLALVTAVVFVVLLLINLVLTKDQAPQGIISFQLAGTAEHSLQILAAWGEDGRFWAALSLWMDYLFLVLYTATLVVFTSYLLSDRPGIRERKIGGWVKALFVAAGLADAGENTFLLYNMGNPTDGLSMAATVMALMKFTGLLLGGAGLVVIRAERRRPLHTS
ncbi:MAG: hypothetical protein R3280_10640 [Marinobacter sp.]|uniref:hypothetical protein n=1 Tax=Marinobacter sp. TaxID=50741 RepID=UPI00299DF99B|nr:hypothetical protein [Marinobacter sp.]MDX1635087.1 hypothetical protein [Marinobacter sp.]